MKKTLLVIVFVASYFNASAQTYLTHVGKDALVTINDGALLYNGGGLNFINDATAKLNNHGDIMIVKNFSTDAVTLQNSSNLTLVFGEVSPLNTALNREVYGQLFITGIAQGSISGKLDKQYLSDYDHSNNTGGSQQIGIPFFGFTTADLVASLPGAGNFNLTSTASSLTGRYAHNSLFRWNNQRSQFDQIVGAATPMGLPTDYFIIPTVKADGTTASWDPKNLKSVWKGTPVADQTATTNAVPLLISSRVSFGSDGSTTNDYRERYNTYLDDPFGETKWTTNYGKNMSQFSNPFLTNIDLYNITSTGLTGVRGIAYYADASVNWTAPVGTTYNGAATLVMATATGGVFQGGDIDRKKLLIKPLTAVMIKFDATANRTANLDITRRFAQTSRNAVTNPINSVTTARAASNIPSDLLVKQIAVVAYDSADKEIGRTYYAVSPSSITGVSEDARLQGFFDGSAVFTKEEISTGGEDTSLNRQLYINEANEIDYKGKEIPLYVNNNAVSKFKFELYEGGERVSTLSNGKNFYFKKDNTVTKLNDGDVFQVNSMTYGLYYDRPMAFLAVNSPGYTRAQTIIAKKDQDWVVSFAQTWKVAEVSVYSAAGQLLHTEKNISTINDYTVPLISKANGLYIIKATSESGEVVVKKVVK